MPKRLIRSAAAVAAAVSLARVLTSDQRRPALARATKRASRALGYSRGRLQGVSYHLRNGHPDPNAAGNVLADRIRSSLGPIEKQLDIPRIHVTVEDHVALLHGAVPTHDAAARIERAVTEISGVLGTESYLHVGPLRDDERPSSGARHPAPSEAHERLVEAAYNAGAPADVAPKVVRAVLAFLADRVPADEFEQFASHLPHDVRTMCTAPNRTGASTVRTVNQLVAGLAPATTPLRAGQAEHVIESIFGALRDLVPEEDHDIAAVLPEDLREFWLASTPH